MNTTFHRINLLFQFNSAEFRIAESKTLRHRYLARHTSIISLPAYMWTVYRIYQFKLYLFKNILHLVLYDWLIGADLYNTAQCVSY